MGVSVVWVLLHIWHCLATVLNVGLLLQSFWKIAPKCLTSILFKFFMRYWEVTGVLVDADSVCAGSAFPAVRADSGPVGWMCLWHWVFWLHWLGRAHCNICLMFLIGTHILCLGFGFGILDLWFQNWGSFQVSIEPPSSPWEGKGKEVLWLIPTASLLRSSKQLVPGALWGCWCARSLLCLGPPFLVGIVKPKLDLEHSWMLHYWNFSPQLVNPLFPPQLLNSLFPNLWCVGHPKIFLMPLNPTSSQTLIY